MYVLSCSLPACHTIKQSSREKPVGSALCVCAQKNYKQHVVRWQVCHSIILGPSLPLTLKFPPATFLGPSRRVIVVLDMEILQSAEESGGLIGNPAAFKDGMVSNKLI